MRREKNINGLNLENHSYFWDRLIVTPLVHLPLLGVGSKLAETVDKLKLLSKKPR